MRLEVILAGDIGVGITTQVMFQKRDGYDQGDDSMPVYLDVIEQFRLVVCIDVLL